MRSKFISILLGVVLGLITFSADLRAASKTTVHWATLGVGSTNYQESVGMAEIIKKHANLNMRIEPTLGEKVWLPLMEKGEIEFALTSLMALPFAYTGDEPYNRKFDFLRMVAVGNPLIYALVTTSKSGIRSVADLRGKRVAVPFGLAYMEISLNAMLKANNMSKSDIRYIKSSTIREANQGLIDKKIDVVYWAISPFLMELNEARGAFIIPLTKDEQRSITSTLHGTLPIISPEGLYGMPATPLVYTPGTIYTSSEVDDMLVYKVIKSLLENTDQLMKYGPTLKNYTLENALSDPALPFHQGAIKYYKEKGVWTNELIKINNELLSK